MPYSYGRIVQYQPQANDSCKRRESGSTLHFTLNGTASVYLLPMIYSKHHLSQGQSLDEKYLGSDGGRGQRFPRLFFALCVMAPWR